MGAVGPFSLGKGEEEEHDKSAIIDHRVSPMVKNV